jgi:hypothetical protein
MSEWIFTAPERWQSLDEVQSPVPWGDTEDLDVVMERAGYCRGEDSGYPDIDYFGAWRIHAATDPASSYQYLLLLELPDASFTRVWCPALPDLMAYMARYGAIGQDRMRQVYQEFLETTLKRLFQAWHGHSADTYCHDCDPEAMREYRERRKRRDAQKAGV